MLSSNKPIESAEFRGHNTDVFGTEIGSGMNFFSTLELSEEIVMHKRSISSVPKRVRPGLVSHILLQSGDTPTDNLAVTWVEVESGARQQPHSHAPEQTYVIVRGRGRM